MDISKGSLPNGSLPNGSLNNYVDKTSSSKKNGLLLNGSLSNSKTAEPSTSTKVINVLNSTKKENATPSSSHTIIEIVNPAFQDSLLEEEKPQGISNSEIDLEKEERPPSRVLLNEEERSKTVFRQIFCCIK